MQQAWVVPVVVQQVFVAAAALPERAVLVGPYFFLRVPGAVAEQAVVAAMVGLDAEVVVVRGFVAAVAWVAQWAQDFAVAAVVPKVAGFAWALVVLGVQAFPLHPAVERVWTHLPLP